MSRRPAIRQPAARGQRPGRAAAVISMVMKVSGGEDDDGERQAMEGSERPAARGSGRDPHVPDNPLYRALNELLEDSGFDEFANEACREAYAEDRGRPDVPPGAYFRMLMVGHLEGIDGERGIAWPCADSLSLREFLGHGPVNRRPDRSSLSKTRRCLSVEAHAAVFGRVQCSPPRRRTTIRRSWRRTRR